MVRSIHYLRSYDLTDLRSTGYGSKLDLGLRSKTEGLKQTGPNLDRDRSGPLFGTDSLDSVQSSDLWSVFGLPYL